MSALDAILGLGDYLGRHSRGVDRSRRVLLPAEWRTEQKAKEFIILVWPPPESQYLLVLPPKRWERMVSKIQEGSLLDEDFNSIVRHISANAYPKALDAYGRLQLPDEAAEAVGIKDEAVLLGCTNRFEIWDPRRSKEMSVKPLSLAVQEKLRAKDI